MRVGSRALSRSVSGRRPGDDDAGVIDEPGADYKQRIADFRTADDLAAQRLGCNGIGRPAPIGIETDQET